MIFLKREEEINVIRESAYILSKTFGLIAQEIRPGVTTKALDKLAEEFISDHGGKPSFKGFKQFPASLCTSVNEIVVHGIPSRYELQEGDIISVDCGVYYKGYHSDSAFTFPVGETGQTASDLLRVAEEALYQGIGQVKAGRRIGDIGQAVQYHAHKHGYSVVRALAGHGIGRNLHEDPEVPNYGKKGSGVKLKQGMVLAIEPIINLGGQKVVQEKDGWTIRTLDKEPSAHFEHTVAVWKHKAEILTTYQYIEEAWKI